MVVFAPMNTPSQAQHYTRRTLSQRWAVSTETLKRREKAGKLPCLKLGKSVRYRIEDIERIEREALVSR